MPHHEPALANQGQGFLGIAYHHLALVAAVDDNGKLGWVQQVGNAPDEVRATDSQFYGVGAFLLAASEMVRLRAD